MRLAARKESGGMGEGVRGGNGVLGSDQDECSFFLSVFFFVASV